MVSKINIKSSLSDIEMSLHEIEKLVHHTQQIDTQIRYIKHAIKEIREYLDPGSQLWGKDQNTRYKTDKERKEEAERDLQGGSER